VVAFHVAATVVTLLQYLRVKDRRLLPLLALFASLAAAHTLGEWDPWGRAFHLAAGFAGLVLLFLLSPRRPPAPTAGSEG
jgi:hypothetical protein